MTAAINYIVPCCSVQLLLKSKYFYCRLNEIKWNRVETSCSRPICIFIHTRKSYISSLNISFYISCVKYSLSLTSNVVIVACLLFILNIKNLNTRHLYDKKPSIYNSQTTLQRLFQNKLHSTHRIFTCDK